MTFARTTRILAVLLVAAALWLARSPAAAKPVAVLGFPGADRGIVAPGEHTALLATGTIALPPATTGASFWRRLFALGEDDSRDPSGLAPLWSDARSPMRAGLVPARLFGGDQDDVAASAFLGNSAGVLVESSDITSGRLPYPYDRAADAISAASATLPRGDWSEWITIEPPPAAEGGARAPSAQFQFARVSDTTYFFSPAYVTTRSPVRASPFLRGAERDLRPILATHALALSHRVLSDTEDAFRKGSDERPVVVFDTVAEDTTGVFAPDSTPASVMEQIRGAISVEIAAVAKAIGPGGILVVVGGPGTARAADPAPWYQVLQAGGSASDRKPQPLEFATARTMIRYVAALPLTVPQKATVPAELVRAAAIRPVAVQVQAAPEPKVERSEWSPSKLESVPGALGNGH